MTSPTHIHAKDMNDLLRQARTRGARFVFLTDAPPLPPELEAPAPPADAGRRRKPTK